MSKDAIIESMERNRGIENALVIILILAIWKAWDILCWVF